MIRTARRQQALKPAMARRIVAQGTCFRALWPIAAVGFAIFVAPATAAPQGAAYVVAQADTAKDGSKKAKPASKTIWQCFSGRRVDLPTPTTISIAPRCSSQT